MKALIFGSGSIACRHSRILAKLGYQTICVSSREIKPRDLYHKNNFLKIITYEKSILESADIFVIANITSQHSRNVQKLINMGIPPNKIFCEKPGPSEFFGINILYNLEFLEILDIIGPPEEIKHCADARVWPSDIPWKKRYVFRYSQGGGVFLTHSHELIHCFKDAPPKSFINQKTLYLKDQDGKNVCIYFKGSFNNISFELDLKSDNPSRYWNHKEALIHFYGETPKLIKNKRIIHITKEMIENSYINMWKQILSDSSIITQKNFTWVLKNVF